MVPDWWELERVTAAGLVPIALTHLAQTTDSDGDGESDLEEFAAEEGYFCDVACNLSEGLERIGLYDYDCIILDINLPDGNGFHLLEVLRIDPDNIKVREKLGFVKINGQWRKEDVLMRQQGFVRDGGRWRTKQELAVKRANEDVEDAEIQ